MTLRISRKSINHFLELFLSPTIKHIALHPPLFFMYNDCERILVLNCFYVCYSFGLKLHISLTSNVIFTLKNNFLFSPLKVIHFLQLFSAPFLLIYQSHLEKFFFFWLPSIYLLDYNLISNPPTDTTHTFFC